MSINGVFFGSATGTVMFGPVQAQIVSWGQDGTSAVVVVPQLTPSTVNVVLSTGGDATVDGVGSAPVPFTVTTAQ
ncbi:MAG TPA: IPT/TIG domain-containing protein [Verrucomicrobiae bacterium]|nr:IPT/TIG domain-containing protein [Verrucomicrobiae bacterium]